MTHDPDTHPTTSQQLAELEFSGRPLIVCDVDEVALHFIKHLDRHMRSNGYELLARSYGLNGNIVGIEDQQPADIDAVRYLLTSFFEDEVRNQTPVDGVTEVLNRLNSKADVVFLTNVPATHRQARTETLHGHGLAFPVITNSGEKGPVVAKIAERAGNPIIFLDDSPIHMVSVRDHHPDTHLIHFVADKRFFDLTDPIDGVHMRTNDWHSVGAHLNDLL